MISAASPSLSDQSAQGYVDFRRLSDLVLTSRQQFGSVVRIIDRLVGEGFRIN
jgi:hypothetical protein